MEKNYKIKNGEITFEEKRIVISDNARRDIRIILFSSGIWVFYGAMSVLRFLKTNDQFLLWSGLLIGIAHFTILILTLRRTNKSEIENSEVRAIVLKQRLGNAFLDIKLKSGKLRRVTLIGKVSQEIKNIIKSFN